MLSVKNCFVYRSVDFAKVSFATISKIHCECLKNSLAQKIFFKYFWEYLKVKNDFATRKSDDLL